MTNGLGMLRHTQKLLLCLLLLAAALQTGRFPDVLPSARADEPSSDSQPSDDLQRLPTDRAALRELERLREAISNRDAESFQSSLRALRAAAPELMTPGPESFQPLHRTLTLLLHDLPEELLAARDSDEPSARTELLRVLQDPQPTELLKLLQRCNGTPTARTIMLLLARIHEDRGESAAARYWLLPLLRSSPPAHVLELQRRLEATGPSPTSETNPPATFPNTIGSSLQVTNSGDLPRNIQWTRSLPLHDTARRTLQEYVNTSTAGSTVPWVAFTPISDSNNIFVRSQSTITALDRQSGRTLWTRNLNPNSKPVNQSPWSSRIIQPFPGTVAAPPVSPSRDARTWQLTMDAERLYVISADIDVLGQFQTEESLRVRMLIGRDANNREKPQELSAIDKLTGRRLWTAGGEPIEAMFKNPLSQSWFPGLPAIHGPDLCLLVEKEGQISLACLTAKDGSLQWQIPIVFPDTGIDQDVFRKLLAAQLKVHDGILVASTTTGWSFAVDLLTRSLMWARQLAPPQPNAPSGNGRVGFRQPVFRGRTLASTSMLSNRRPELPLVIGDEVLWTLNELPQITVTSLLSGEIKRRLTAAEAPLVLWADNELLVTASANEISAWQTSDFTLRWRSQLNSKLSVPVGTAVRRLDQLLIPAADGSLQIRNLATGQLADSIPSLRPIQQPGTLTAIDTDLISAGPGYLTVAAARQPTPQPGEDPLEQAAFLLATNQPSEALRVLDTAPRDSLSQELINHLRFRATLCLFATNSTNPAAEIEQLRALAGPPPEQAIAAWLRLSDSRLPQGPERVRQLVDALLLPQAVLSVELPDTSKLLETARVGGIENILAPSAVATGLDTLRWPLKSLLLQQLEILLNGPDPEIQNAVLQQLSQISDNALCSLRSARLSGECLSRAEQQLNVAPPTEISLHLLFTAAENIELETQPTVRDDARLRLQLLFDKAAGRAAENPAYTPFEQDLIANLIRTLAKEVCQPPSFTPAPADNSLTPTPAATAAWQSVAEITWNLIPVNTNGQINLRSAATRNLRTSLASDPVLNSCRWSSQPESGEFIAQPVSNTPDGTWRLRLQSPDQQLLTPDESLLRCGSVVIHRSHNSIAAFSLVDHRWLWSRSDFNVSYSISGPTTFTDFDIDREGRQIHEQGRRLAGNTNRWLCLLSDSSLEVLDLLTGEQLWHLKSQGLSRNTFACNSAVFTRLIDSTPASRSPSRRSTELILDPTTGRPRPRKTATIPVNGQQDFKLPATARMAALARNLVRSSGNHLVAWDPDSQLDETKSVAWIDALSLETVHNIPIKDFAAAQFLDPALLAVFTTTGNVLLIDLQTAHVQNLEGAGSLPDLPDLPATEIGAAIDAGNLYLFRIPDPRNAAVRPSTFYNVPTTLAQEQLRAIDRQTGKLRWTMPLPKPLYFVFDHSPNPALLALHAEQEAQAANNPIPGLAIPANPQIEVLGLSKFNGHELFRCPVVSQFPVPGLKLTISDSSRMELEAFGNRVRLRPASATEKR